MILDEVHRGIKKRKKRRRIGRGPGSGHGKTSGRGHKGQGSRAGFSKHPTFQGGAMPMVRRIPKRGFNNRWAQAIVIVNISDLQDTFKSGDDVTPETLLKANLAKGRYDQLKVLGEGELKKKLNVSAHRFSKSAREKIESAGGTVTLLVAKTPVEAKKQAAKQRAAKQRAAK